MVFEEIICLVGKETVKYVVGSLRRNNRQVLQCQNRIIQYK